MKPVSLLVLTSPGCTHCHAFLEFWKEASSQWPNVSLKEVSLVTPEGQELVGKYQIFASPGIIVNDELFATGGFDPKKFTEKLQAVSS
jgi:glutaredoxin